MSEPSRSPPSPSLLPWSEWILTDHGVAADLAEMISAAEEWGSRVASSGIPEVHTWTGPRGVVFGRTDPKRERYAQATAALDAAGIPWAVRTSGGTAVPQGPGITDVMVVLPRGRERIDVVTDYLLGLAPVVAVIASFRLTAEHAAIPGTFCDGPYDIAVVGKKVAGTAQTRRLDHSQVGAAILREGRSEELMQDEQIARQAWGDSTPVRWERIASLSELAGRPISHPELVAGLRSVLGST